MTPEADCTLKKNGGQHLDAPGDVAWLLRVLREAGAVDAVQVLLGRGPVGHVSLDAPWDVAWLLRELGEAGADDAVQVLLGRDPAGHAGLENPRAVAGLLRELHALGAEDAARTLAARAAGQARVDDLREIAELLWGAARGRGRRRGPYPGRPSRRTGPP